MLYALDRTLQKVLPTPHAKCTCPVCGGEVIPKCGNVNAWHFAHKTADCDSFSEPESEWHLAWKREFSPHQTEVTINKDGILHRADVRAECGTIIEFQHSTITPEEIADREEFYGKMIWVFDVSDAWLKQRFTVIRNRSRLNDGQFSFRWKRPKKHIFCCEKPVFLDRGDGMLIETKRLYTGEPEEVRDNKGLIFKSAPKPWGGWGHLIGKTEFLKRHKAKEIHQLGLFAPIRRPAANGSR